jgi:sarcosine oxidase subunit beta
MVRPLDSADAVIVGGGVVGCALAYQLARRGANVALVERDELGIHSTGRNAGGVRQQFSTEVNVRIQLLSTRLLDEFEDETGIDPGFRKIGYLFALTQPSDERLFRELLEMWHRVGLTDATWLESDDVRALAPSLTADVSGGTFCPSDGIASPTDVTYGYSRRARELGARFYQGCTVTGITRRGDRVEAVETTSGPIRCSTVFICAGAWSAEVGRLAGVELPVRPYRRHIFMFGPVAGVDRDSPMTVDFATSLYYHAEGEGVLVGMSDSGDEPTFDTAVDEAFVEKLFDVAGARMPALLDAELRTAWAGLYEVTPDHQPVVGPLESVPGLWCVCGFSGHGFMQAPAIALLVAERWAEERSRIDLSPFEYARFTARPLERERAVI